MAIRLKEKRYLCSYWAPDYKAAWSVRQTLAVCPSNEHTYIHTFINIKILNSVMHLNPAIIKSEDELRRFVVRSPRQNWEPSWNV